MTNTDALAVEEYIIVAEMEGERPDVAVDPTSDHEAAVEGAVWARDLDLAAQGVVSYERANSEFQKWRERRIGNTTLAASTQTVSAA